MSENEMPREIPFQFTDKWAIDFCKLASKKMRQAHGKKDKSAAVNDRMIELAEECLRWRASHDRGKDVFNPDYCAARDALKEHLEHCKDHVAALEARVRELENSQEIVLPMNKVQELIDDENNNLRAKLQAAEKMAEAFSTLIELQDAALSLEDRANGIVAPEDKHIREICEKYGYGAVMDSAARQWHLRDGFGGGKTTYHCYIVVQKETMKAKEALAAYRSKGEINTRAKLDAEKLMEVRKLIVEMNVAIRSGNIDSYVVANQPDDVWCFHDEWAHHAENVLTIINSLIKDAEEK